MKELIKELRSIFEKNEIYKKLENHNTTMLDSNFWKDKLKSKSIIKEKKLYEDLVNTFNSSEKKLTELDELNNLALEEDNQEIQKEVLDKVKDLRKLIKSNEIKCFLSKESDSLDC